MNYERVRVLARALPGVEDGTSYGTPALKVKGKLLARLREDGETLVLRTDVLSRDALLRAAPTVFFLTDHYRDYPWVLVRLRAVRADRMRELLEDAWRLVAPRPLVRERDAGRGTPRSPRGGGGARR